MLPKAKESPTTSEVYNCTHRNSVITLKTHQNLENKSRLKRLSCCGWQSTAIEILRLLDLLARWGGFRWTEHGECPQRMSTSKMAAQTALWPHERSAESLFHRGYSWVHLVIVRLETRLLWDFVFRLLECVTLFNSMQVFHSKYHILDHYTCTHSMETETFHSSYWLPLASELMLFTAVSGEVSRIARKKPFHRVSSWK